jgi:hypothetical protein
MLGRKLGILDEEAIQKVQMEYLHPTGKHSQRIHTTYTGSS